MVKIELKQERIVDEGPIYCVKNTVVSSQGIDRNIFVYNTETDAFEYVAFPWDMDNYPATKAQAVIDGLDYYRVSIADIPYGDNIDIATKAAIYTRARVDVLAEQYATVKDDFEGSGDYIYTGGS